MGVRLEIPDEIVQAIRIPEDRIEKDLKKEFALALYEHGFISFGKANELAGISKLDFSLLLGGRGIVRHYGPEELEDDLAYARGQ